MSSPVAVITVSELNRLARLAIEKSLPSCWVSGEISNFTRANSGHWYFTLKDQHSGVRCAFFRNRNQFLNWLPSEGDKVEIRAQATLYEPRGDYQLQVDAMRRDGQGALYEEFLRLKAKLEAEGLFLPERKLKPPRIPRQLGVVTSLQAAALQDVLKTLTLRWPNCPLVIYPTSVQGTDAAAMIRQSLNAAISRNECDVILLIRGGGSLEDLLPFNDESLARTIYSSPIPVITGIGHETDFSIADFVADIRAATPTAAAQLAVPDRQDIYMQVRNLHTRMTQSETRRIYQQMQHLDGLSRRVLHPGNAVSNSQKNIAQIKRRLSLGYASHLSQEKQILENRVLNLMAHAPKLATYRNNTESHAISLKTALTQTLANRKTRVETCLNSLHQLNPDNILSRGYCIAFHATGEVIRHAEALCAGSKVKIKLKQGGFDATVDQVTTTNK